jgi:putative nucleotidyltransferase with HDIG domain
MSPTAHGALKSTRDPVDPGNVQETDAPPAIGVRALIAELTELPANPSVAVRVLQLLDDPRTDAARLGRLVETDPSLAAHALRLANAPIHGMTRRITAAREAVMVLGFELVRSLAALTAGGVLGSGRKASPPGFWAHSLATAAGSMVIARHVKANEGEACSAGLLHDLGSCLQYRAAPARYDAMTEEAAGDALAWLEAEKRHFELDHAEAGATVLAAWGFPGEIVEVLREHHHLPVPETSRLVLIVRAGEALAGLVERFPSGECAPDLVESLTAIGLGELDVDALFAEVIDQLNALRSVLG